MKQERDFGRFLASTAEAPVPSSEESLVNDARADLTPAQMVERKLVRLLQGAPLPVSRLQMSTPRRSLA